MTPQVATKLTYEDFLLLPDDGRRHEIIDGEHYVNPSPNTRHQMVSMRLSFALYAHVSEHQLGHVFTAPYDVVLGEHDIVEPDLIYVSNARGHVITRKNIEGAPDLLVEILSPSKPEYDTRLKFKTYERYGVAEYWIVDPDAGAISVFRHSGTSYVRAEAADPLTTPLLPGFTLPLRTLFA